MPRVLVLASLLACLCLGSLACAAIQGLDEYTTALPPMSSTPVDDGSADPEPPRARPNAVPALEVPCSTNRECAELLTVAGAGAAGLGVRRPAVCLAATGTCASLVTEDCTRVVGDYEDDRAVVLGSLLGGDESASLEQAVLLAVEELDGRRSTPSAAGAVTARPLVLVACDVSGAGAARRATRHLAETLHVPAIIGPTSAESVVDLTQQITAKAGTLLMTPTSSASSIANLADGDLTWRVTPSDAQRAKLLIEQIKDLEALLRATRTLTSVKLGIVHATDALGISARDAIRGKLILNGRFIDDAANAANVSVDAHAPGDRAAEIGVANEYAVTFQPDIVFLSAAEQIASVAVPLEQALTAARAIVRPYYVVTDAVKTRDLLDAVASGALPADIGRRVRGVGVKPDASSTVVLDDFRAAFAARYHATPSEPGAALAYDATYAVAYAIAATASLPLGGASVAHGLRTLAVGRSTMVGPKESSAVLSDLAAGRLVSLRGTHGLLRWDASGDVTGGTIEVWCIGSLGGAPAFKSSGLTMDVQTQVVGGAYVQCQ